MIIVFSSFRTVRWRLRLVLALVLYRLGSNPLCHPQHGRNAKMRNWCKSILFKSLCILYKVEIIKFKKWEQC